jgi:hypothetical protein
LYKPKNKKIWREKIFFMKDQPLYMPKGSVRAILTLIITIFICVAFFLKIALPEYIVVAWSGLIGWYFAGRTTADSKDEQKSNNS